MAYMHHSHNPHSAATNKAAGAAPPDPAIVKRIPETIKDRETAAQIAARVERYKALMATADAMPSGPDARMFHAAARQALTDPNPKDA